MIPLAQIIQWRQTAPWTDDMQVEQDLILSRAIVEIFSNPFLAEQLAFRGGTALHKLFFSPAARYSEDIDLVRTSKGEIKEIIDALRAKWFAFSIIRFLAEDVSKQLDMALDTILRILAKRQ